MAMPSPRRGAVKYGPDLKLTALQKAAAEGNVEELRRLRVGEAGGVPVDATDIHGMTALHIAADDGRLEAVQYVL